MGEYEKIGTSIGVLVDEKNVSYGDSFHEAGRIMRILYPGGIELHQYDDILAIVRIIDKLFRIANQKGALGENPFEDIAGYGILKSREPV